MSKVYVRLKKRYSYLNQPRAVLVVCFLTLNSSLTLLPVIISFFICTACS